MIIELGADEVAMVAVITLTPTSILRCSVLIAGFPLNILDGYIFEAHNPAMRARLQHPPFFIAENTNTTTPKNTAEAHLFMLALRLYLIFTGNDHTITKANTVITAADTSSQLGVNS